jgi:hypothetical protein
LGVRVPPWVRNFVPTLYAQLVYQKQIGKLYRQADEATDERDF